ncbi:MAG: decaprenyl-phosphate phosphoribosyltransferase [Flavobacteriales bacterium]|nr:decaprenyl-phosphate phosphoribosyltransferase [Flavobacteriales bacterium]
MAGTTAISNPSPSLFMRFTATIRLLRIEQWVKNGFLFFPAFFAGVILHPDVLVHVVSGFFAFSMAASGVYVLNDIRDKEQDRAHPEKRERPIASGMVPIDLAWGIFLALAAGGLASAFLLDPDFGWLLAGYLVMNVLYSFKLKQLAIVDITCIALGFLIRIWSGGVLADVPITMWIEIMTFLLALFIAFAKRRDDLLLDAGGEAVRKSISGYNLPMVQASMVFVASVTVVAYIMYSVSADVSARLGTDKLYYTSVFVVLGMLRYFQLALVHERTGSPTKLVLKDLSLQLVIAGWVISLGILLYAN